MTEILWPVMANLFITGSLHKIFANPLPSETDKQINIQNIQAITIQNANPVTEVNSCLWGWSQGRLPEGGNI